MRRGSVAQSLSDLVTVAVSPRERQLSLIPSLLSLFSTIPSTVRVVVAQGDLPDDLRASLEELKGFRDFDLIAPDYPLFPQEARNLCIQASRTELIVLTDNDMHYDAGWLEALVQNAVDNDADMVAPLIFIGPPKSEIIHHAGGRITITPLPDGRLHANEIHIFARDNVSDVDVRSVGTTNHTVEFHCCLMRASFLAKLGGLDERLTSQEQIHYGLLAHHLGSKVTFEPEARVTYYAKKFFQPVDLDYLSFRWSDKQALQSMQAIQSAWGIYIGEEEMLSIWVRRHRARAYSTLYRSQAQDMDMNEFLSEFMAPREAKALLRAMTLRDGKKLMFTVPIDPTRRAETLDAFLVPAPEAISA